MTDPYSATSFGALSVGYGERPAVVVVDFQKGFTDPRFELGRSPSRPRRCRANGAASEGRARPQRAGRELPRRVGEPQGHRVLEGRRAPSGLVPRRPDTRDGRTRPRPRLRFQFRQERAVDLLRDATGELLDQASRRHGDRHGVQYVGLRARFDRRCLLLWLSGDRAGGLLWRRGGRTASAQSAGLRATLLRRGGFSGGDRIFQSVRLPVASAANHWSASRMVLAISDGLHGLGLDRLAV